MKAGTSKFRKAVKSPRGEPRQVAVVDCGTSSVRAYIAEIDGAKQRILEEIQHPIDLTAAFDREKLDREAMDQVVEAFDAVVKVASDFGVHQLRAVATSAFREAANSDVLVERLRTKLGVDLEVIDSAEEARLYIEALRRLLERTGTKLEGTVAMIDVGGGSTSLALMRGGNLLHSVDEHFGTLRLRGLFKDLIDTTDYGVTVGRYSLGAAKMMLSRLPEANPDHLAITGSEVRRLLALLRPGAEGEIEPLPAAEVAAWLARVQVLPPLERARACGCDEFTSTLLLPAAALVHHICALTGRDTVLVPRLTLRDGLLADLLPGALGPHHLSCDQLLAEARQLARRFGSNLDYCENTAALAVQVFDQTHALHGLTPQHRLLLEFSALVHDIGSYINVRNRHKHAMYIIQGADLAGLTKNEKEMVAHIARYHRRSPPQSHHAAFQALPRRNRVVVAHLAAILRLAYGLDVERTQRIRKVRCEVAGNRLLLHVDRRQIALERWSIAGKAQLFEEVFGLTVVVVAREEE
jgi:exopolyphosphatase/guanosine-5'-triphosphate,3'-diphosphate pyrophosphatase